MNKRIDLSNLGGFPLEQDSLQFMQESYRGVFAALARLCGAKTILYGVELVAGNITDGWISYNGELIPFIGGAPADYVVIQETAALVQSVFEDGTPRDVYFTKTATLGVSGDFLFADLVKLQSLEHTWTAGDIKEVYISNADMATEFGVDGYGLTKYKGWRKLSSVYATAAGKVTVNHNAADADFDECGKNGGSKTQTLTKANLPAVPLNIPLPGDTAGSGGITFQDGTGFTGKNVNSENMGSGTAHNNLQPYFVTLKLLKL